MSRIVLCLLLWAAGCKESSEQEGCDPGSREACPCAGGGSGERTCGPDRAFESCRCTQTDGGVNADGGDEDGGGDPNDAGISDSGSEPTCSPTSGREQADCVLAQVSCGLSYTCVRRAWGEIDCFGGNEAGQLGRDNAPDPGTPWTRNDLAPVAGLEAGVQLLVSGSTHACALMANGRVRCWGSHENGRLGDGVDPVDRPVSHEAVVVTALQRVTEISLGATHSCAAQRDGDVLCWGANDYGMLGTGADATQLPFSAVPVGVEGIENPARVAAGGQFTCAIDRNGNVLCWGRADEGQLGRAGIDHSLTPVTVQLPTVAEELIAGERHACAQLTDGSLWCWGANDRGQIGADETVLSSATPVQIERDDLGVPIDGLTSLTAGRNHNCGMDANRAVVCWGDWEVLCAINPKPVLPSAFHWYGMRAVSVSAGWAHTCVLRLDNRVHCFGDNQLGQSRPTEPNRSCEHDLPVSILP